MIPTPRPGNQAYTEAIYLVSVLVIGVALYFYRFGFLVLDPAKVDWLLGGYDVATYYIGWHYFRLEPWGFPLGRIENYLAPLGTSIPLVDALPLLAIPLKTLASRLPSEFQYFGFWILLNHGLQGVFAYLVLRTRSSSRLMSLVGALFFIFCPTFLIRYGHIALASHWLLLAAVYIYLRPLTSWGVRRKLISWLALAAVVSLVHTYLTAMVLGIAWADLTRELLTSKRLARRHYALALVVLCGVTVSSWYATGYLIYGGDTDIKTPGYGTYSMNLNSLFNSMGNSLIFPALPTDTGQYEGFNYLGAGMLLLGMLIIHVLLTRKDISKKVKSHKALFVVLICFLLFALSNRLLLGETIIFSNREFFFFKPIASAFRASGRFFWPVLYFGMAFGFAIIVKQFRFRHALTILLAVFLLQVFDISPMLNQRSIFTGRELATPLESPRWREAVTKLEGIMAYPPYQPNLRLYGDFKYLAWLTACEGKPVSAGYAARIAYHQSRAIEEEMRTSFISGQADPDYLYVFSDGEFLNHYLSMRNHFRSGNWDGYKVFFANDADITATNHYGDLNRIGLADYLQGSDDKLLFLTITHRADLNACTAYHEIFKHFNAPVDSSSHLGSFAAVVCQGDVRLVQFSKEEPVQLDFSPGHALCGELFSHSVSLVSDSNSHLPTSSIHVDGNDEAFNLEGINIVAFDQEQDLVEVAHFSGAWDGEGHVLEVIQP